jgi:hypothetical protein
MPNIAGNLLINRMQILLPTGPTDIDTGLQQNLRAFPVGEPTDDPALGAASRVMVIPMMPLVAWIPITHGEPYLDSTTKTVHVAFVNGGPETVIDALFWDPHSIVGPLSAVPYNVGP